MNLGAALFLVVLAGVGCKRAPDDTGDSFVPEDPPDPVDDDEGCEDTYLKTNGPEPPHVGDTWNVFMWCDGALLMGPYILQIQPMEFALIDENYLTFQVAGTGTIQMQMGTYQEELEVTVLAR